MPAGSDALDAVERAQFFSGARAANNQAMLSDFIEIESVQRLAKLKHHVIRDIHHVVDRSVSERFEALPQPIGRGLHFHAADDPGREARAKFRRFDRHAGGLRYRRGGLGEFRLHAFQRQAIESGGFARDAVMAKAIGAIGRQFGIEHRPGR